MKVLLVTETPPGTPNGFGVTLKCLFHKTPHKVLYTDAEFKNHGEKEGYLLAQVPYHPARRHFLSFKMGNIPEWRGNFSSKWLKRHLNEPYGKVFAFVYSIDCLYYADWIAQQIKTPLIVHIADHCDSFEHKSAVSVMQKCNKLICITEKMKSKYESVLGRKDIEVLHNGAEENCFNLPSSSPASFDKENPLRLCFIGGLFSHLHGECIEDVVEAVRLFRLDRDFMEFHLYGQRNPACFGKEIFSQSGIKHHGIVMPLEKKYQIMEEAHCFIIPSSFNEDNHRCYRFSFPTKLPELIATGKPIISYGPRDTATNRLLENNSIGIRIHNRSIKCITDALTSIANQYPEILKKNQKNNANLRMRFSAEAMRQKLSQILLS